MFSSLVGIVSDVWLNYAILDVHYSGWKIAFVVGVASGDCLC